MFEVASASERCGPTDRPTELSRCVDSLPPTASNNSKAAPARIMGADLSTERMERLTSMGFSIAESRLALEAAGGDVQRAAELLIARRDQQNRAAGGALARRINGILQEQRPWNEFFERFLWPEHLQERLQTNLLYYRGNYLVICAGVSTVGILLQPTLLVVAGLVGAAVYGAAEWGDEPVPGLNQRLTFEQRMCGAAFASAALVNYSGALDKVARIFILCAGLVLGHGAMRARSIAARWTFFKETVEASAKAD